MTAKYADLSRMGQNPTSGVLSLKRRRELYAVCQKYDVIIVEDDPYWYLQFPSATKKLAKQPADDANLIPKDWRKSGYDFLDSLVPSSLNIDTDGRVIRLDTFSKTIAPGCRLGWITAQPALVERILRITETSTQQPSGFVQSMIAEMMLGPGPDGKGPAPGGEGWNADGWVRWIEGLRGNYERRMNVMASTLDAGKEIVKSGRRNSLSEALAANTLSDNDDDEWAVVEKTQIYSFDWPVGGMFLWVRLHFETHPLAGKVPGPRLSRAMWLFWTTKPYLVLVSPGTIFSPTPEIRDSEGWQYYRLCFAACDEDQLLPISKRFVDGVNAFWRIKDVKKIDKLLEEEDQATENGVNVEDMTRMSEVGHLMGPCAF